MGGGWEGGVSVACALSVISFLLIQKFFALLKSDHNDNYTSVAPRRVATSTLCGKIYVRMWSDKRLAEWGGNSGNSSAPTGGAAVECRVCCCCQSQLWAEEGERKMWEQVMQPLLLG